MERLKPIAASFILVATLSACSSTQDVLEPSAIAASPPTPASLQAISADTASPLNPGIAANTRLRFDAVVGPTPEAAAPLAARLSERAQARGIPLAGATDSSATHVVKGYLSALTEGAETTVIYVWDVYDAAGNRLHRINGSQKARGGRLEGWPAVSSVTMQTIGDSTVDELTSWLSGGTG